MPADFSSIQKRIQMSYTISIGCDHAGLELAKELSVGLFDIGHNINSFFPALNTRVDYPDYAFKTCSSVTLDSHTISRGILVCGSGVGMAIAANRNSGIRCVNTNDPEIVKIAREHNDVNVLALGARIVTDKEQLWKCVTTFLDTKYEGGRHEQRVMKLFGVYK